MVNGFVGFLTLFLGLFKIIAKFSHLSGLWPMLWNFERWPMLLNFEQL